MKLSDIQKYSLIEENERLSGGSSYCYQTMLNATQLPNVEFGKTYYGVLEDTNKISGLYAIKFRGVGCFPSLSDWHNESSCGLIGETSANETIVVTQNFTYIFNKNEYRCIPNICKLLYETKEDYNTKNNVELIDINFLYCRIVNYLSKRRFHFKKYTTAFEKSYYIVSYRYSWNGKETIFSFLPSYSNFVIILSKPLNELRFNICKDKTYIVNDITKGIMYYDKSNNISCLDIQSFINDTYFSKETCDSSNQIQVYEFPNEETQEEKDIIFVDGIGYMSRQKAEQMIVGIQKSLQ